MNATYQAQKKEALIAGEAVSILEFVETLAMVLETSELVSGGRASELMAMTAHLLRCREVCEKHSLMREVLGLK